MINCYGVCDDYTLTFGGTPIGFIGSIAIWKGVRVFT